LGATWHVEKRDNTHEKTNEWTDKKTACFPDNAGRVAKNSLSGKQGGGEKDLEFLNSREKGR